MVVIVGYIYRIECVSERDTDKEEEEDDEDRKAEET
jgi:hypothetical protein